MILYDPQGNFIVGPTIPLGTKKGREIPNEQAMQRSPVQMEAARDIIVTHHSSANVRSLSSVYNCMGMAFASRRSGVEPEYLEWILGDDGYRRVSDEGELVPGDLVVYRDDQGDVSHVGVITEIRTNVREGVREVFVLSQWGRDGEYFHEVDDVSPLLGKPSEYWTDRV